ncbi:MAG: RagB/SusD family nutrient uptake outer membrane protein [Bacteroidetes bacterium]|nr:RagB/SusD family nutrient uptake outer membrane protein [Bacteroidota bacterium]MBS1747571.1 RagB/SusD family nutrient uptake outer membrane protein [Bacteroidota bacterium]
MKKIYSYILLLLSLTSCKKILEIDTPIDRITTDIVFADDATANLAVTGLYNRMMEQNSYITSGAMTIYCGLTADEFTNTSPGVDDEFSTNSISTTNSIVEQNFWASAYSLIYHANSIIEGLERSKGVSSQMKKQLKGEAEFVRALVYFNMVNIFSDVPLIVSTNYKENAAVARMDRALIYEQIQRDLLDATTALPDSYNPNERVRATKWTAYALLARVYLFRKDWTNARSTASVVIGSGQFGLVNNITEVFKQNSTETIFQLNPVVVSISTWEGNLFIPGSGAIPNYSINSGLLSIFDSSDLRLANWISSTNVGGVNYYYPFKYQIKSGSGDESYIVLRYAEQFLIRAEANTQLNNISEAQNDLNIVRQRAGISPTTANTSNDLLLAIEDERRREYFAEWGFRWIDLKRTDHATAVLSALKPNWQPTDTLFPIPISEIRKNNLLTQNAGY